MPALQFVIDGLLPGDVDFTVRGRREIAKAASMAVGLYWDEKLKPLHFEPDAATKYHYTQRTEAYLKRKQGFRRDPQTGQWVPGGGMLLRGPGGQRFRAVHGGTRLLVLRGELRRAVMRKHIPRAFPSRVTIDIPGPRYLNMRANPRRRSAPNLGEEVTRTTPAEVRELQAVYEQAAEDATQAYIQKYPGKRRNIP